MAYTKTNWTETTDITPALLDHAEGQYDEAKGYIDAHLRAAATLPLLAQVSAAAPDHAEGRIYYDSVTGVFSGSTSAAWMAF